MMFFYVCQCAEWKNVFRFYEPLDSEGKQVFIMWKSAGSSQLILTINDIHSITYSREAFISITGAKKIFLNLTDDQSPDLQNLILADTIICNKSLFFGSESMFKGKFSTEEEICLFTSNEKLNDQHVYFKPNQKSKIHMSSNLKLNMTFDTDRTITITDASNLLFNVFPSKYTEYTIKKFGFSLPDQPFYSAVLTPCVFNDKLVCSENITMKYEISEYSLFEHFLVQWLILIISGILLFAYGVFVCYKKVHVVKIQKFNKLQSLQME